MKNFATILFLNLSCSFSSFGQIQDIVQTDGILNDLHKVNVGKIVFTASNIPLADLKTGDFLTTFELNKTSNLNIRVFLDNSIINYQHRLAPELTAEVLTVSGNYQFSFFVDDKFIYKENLHHGCGLKKNTTTTFRVPFTDTQGADFWSVYFWDRFKRNGGGKALSDGTHKVKVEIRPYVKISKNDEAIVGDLIAEGQLQLVIKPKKITTQQIDIQSIKPNSMRNHE